jgi:chromosome segregation ATPase
MLIVEENKNKIDRIINVARNIIENSPYKVLHFDRVEKEVAESRLREMQKLWNESKEIMELSAKINDLQRKKQKQAEELKRKQRRLAAWQLLEAKAKETVAEYEKETSADVTGAARIFLGVLRSDASLAAIEALKAELAGSYGPDAKLDRILQLMEFLLGRWREPNRQGVVMLKAGSRLQMKLTGKFNEFLREYPEFDRSRQP